MEVIRIGALLGIVAWVFAASFASPAGAAEGARDPARHAFAGFVRGPLTPKDAATLTALFVDELDGYDSFRLVDVRGHALDERLLAADAALVARLRDEAVDAFLRFDHAKALAKLDQAIAIFESRLMALRDYELLHDALLARAETLHQSGDLAAARAALSVLAALAPDERPTKATHARSFLALWKKAKEGLGPVGTVAVECAVPGARVQLDGASAGSAPVVITKVRPGKHYVVATWPDQVLAETVQVAPGRETKVVLSPAGPAEDARVALAGALTARPGPEAANEATSKIASLARAARVLVASARKDARGLVWLSLSVHEASGALRAVARAPLLAAADDQKTSQLVRELAAALFVDDREGELQLDARGGARPASGLIAFVYGGVGPEPPELELEVVPPPVGAELGSLAPPPPPIVEPPSDGVAWWVWAIVGGAAVAGGAVAAAILLSPDPTTTTFEVRLP